LTEIHTKSLAKNRIARKWHLAGFFFAREEPEEDNCRWLPEKKKNAEKRLKIFDILLNCKLH
jgi:hypothetical protein